MITRDANGRLYVSDRENDRIQVFNESGNVLDGWEGLRSIGGLHAGADDLFYASCGIDNALLRLDRAGHVLDVWIPPDGFRYPHAIATGRDGCLYVAETGDAMRVTGPKSEDRFALKRNGPEGSAAKKLLIDVSEAALYPGSPSSFMRKARQFSAPFSSRRSESLLRCSTGPPHRIKTRSESRPPRSLQTASTAV